MCIQNDPSGITLSVAKIYQEIYQDDLREMYLYDSYARRDYDGESDIDLAAVVNGDRAELQKKPRQVWDVAAELGLQYDMAVSSTVIPESY